MQVQFQTVLFDSEDFRFAVVNDNVLTIVTGKGELDLQFGSEDEALDAQVELGEVLDSAKGSNIGNVLQEAAEVVSGLFGSLLNRAETVKRTVRTKAQAAASATKAAKTVEDFAQDLVSQLEQALNPAGATRTTRSTAQDAEDVFGTSRTSRTRREVTADSVVSTLTDAELREVIEVKAEQLIATNRQVQELVAQLRRHYTPSEVQEAIAQHKEMVFNVARANDHLTVNAVFAGLLG